MAEIEKKTKRIHDVALMLDRERVGREASPTGGVIDSQSVKAPEAKTRGYDAGKLASWQEDRRTQATSALCLLSTA